MKTNGTVIQFLDGAKGIIIGKTLTQYVVMRIDEHYGQTDLVDFEQILQ